MLIIEEIKKSLDAGNAVELECIDEMGFISRHECNVENNEIILNQGRLTVATVCNDMDSVILEGNINPDISNTIHFEELQYFRIKRPTPTFDDLIDVAVQAMKEGKLYFRFLSDEQVSFSTENKEEGRINVLKRSCDKKELQDAIDHINSLYTETFVIESEEDIKKIDLSTAEIEYQNGFKTKIKARNPQDNTLLYKYDKGGSAIKVSINELKGATVTQKRCAA